MSTTRDATQIGQTYCVLVDKDHHTVTLTGFAADRTTTLSVSPFDTSTTPWLAPSSPTATYANTPLGPPAWYLVPPRCEDVETPRPKQPAYTKLMTPPTPARQDRHAHAYQQARHRAPAVGRRIRRCF